MTGDVRKVAAAGVLLLVAIWFLTDALPDGLRDPIRDKLMWVAALAIAGGLFTAGALSLPWWAGWAAGAGVLVAAGAAPTLRKLLDGARDGDPGQYIECGDFGTCGAIIDGSLCLGFHCRSGSQEDGGG